MMAEDSSGGCDDIPQRVERIREKETEMKKRREELTSLKKKFIEEHLKLGRDDQAMREEITMLEEVMAECNKRTAADGTVCYELPGDIVSLIGDGNSLGMLESLRKTTLTGIQWQRTRRRPARSHQTDNM